MVGPTETCPTMIGVSSAPLDVVAHGGKYSSVTDTPHLCQVLMLFYLKDDE